MKKFIPVITHVKKFVNTGLGNRVEVSTDDTQKIYINIDYIITFKDYEIMLGGEEFIRCTETAEEILKLMEEGND